MSVVNPLNPELNPICYLLALLGAHHFLHVSRITVKFNLRTLSKSGTRHLMWPIFFYLEQILNLKNGNSVMLHSVICAYFTLYTVISVFK
jgi:hypothetical protein